jgi:hypothetical protein
MVRQIKTTTQYEYDYEYEQRNARPVRIRIPVRIRNRLFDVLAGGVVFEGFAVAFSER